MRKGFNGIVSVLLVVAMLAGCKEREPEVVVPEVTEYPAPGTVEPEEAEGIE